MDRQRLGTLVATGIIGTVLGGLALGSTPAAAQRLSAGRESTCLGVITSTAKVSPEDACAYQLSVHVEPRCPVCAGGINVVFVQLGDALQADWQNDTAQSALKVVEDIAQNHRTIRVQGAVIHYRATSVRVAVPMTDNLGTVESALGEPMSGYDPFADVEGAARAAVRQLELAHRDDPALPDEERCDLVILYGWTKPTYVEMRTRFLNAANQIKREKVPLLVGCPEAPHAGETCNFIKEMSREFTQAGENGRMRSMTQDHIQDYTDASGLLRLLTMVQRIPPGLTYVDGSASIPPTEVKQADGMLQLTWGWERPRELRPISVTYTVKPEPGVGAVYQVDGQLKIVDAENKSRDVVMASQAITVPEGICLPAPTPTGTPTPVPPTDTPVATDPPVSTRTPSASRTPVPTSTLVPTASHTSTPPPGPIYLPIIFGEVCFKESVHGDVVLVIDTSTSMNRESRGGLSKMTAAIGAAHDFVRAMDFAPDNRGHHDQVAVVGFNDRAWIQTGLTSDAAAARAALADLPKGQAEGTRLDLGFQRGLEAVTGAGRIAGNRRVMILLTDGLPNRVPAAEDGSVETTVRRAAEAAKGQDVRTYTIGLGAPSDLNAELLTQCASDASASYVAPEPEDLTGIYRQIAYAIDCPPDSFWGRR